MTKRRVLLSITLIFIAGLTALTGVDLARNGVNPLDILSILILLLFWVGIVGALRAPRGR